MNCPILPTFVLSLQKDYSNWYIFQEYGVWSGWYSYKRTLKKSLQLKMISGLYANCKPISEDFRIATIYTPILHSDTNPRLGSR